MSLRFSLKKTFPGFDTSVELSAEQELMVLFGPSGAGKSLILKMVSGIIRPDAGIVSVDGETVFDSSSGIDAAIRKRKIGYLFQDYALFPHMTVRDNIAYGVPRTDKARAEGRVKELIEVMRLTGLENRYPHEISGGQKQRTALARTLAAGPRILLLDEPFSALDFQVREKLRADLANIHRLFPVTTVLVTHDLEEAFMLGSRIAVINNGRFEQVGSREDVFYRPATRNVARFLGVRNIFDGRVLNIRGEEVEIDTPGLGTIKTHAPKRLGLSVGGQVTFCIRPEEILVIRPEKGPGKVADNVVEGDILSTTGKGSTHILYLGSGATGVVLKIELPNFVLRKLGLKEGKRIKVALKKENIWIIP
jgi:molybdate transport system ATP-binding protein